MTVTNITGLTEDESALAVIGATAFAETEIGLLQQILVAIANS